MKKKLYIITFLFAISIIFILASSVFAQNNMPVVDNIRNVVGGAENTIENAGNNIAGGIKNVTSNGQNTMENMTGDMGNAMNDAGNTIAGTFNNDNNNDDYNNDYSATRTSADVNGTFMGMNSMAWTWLIIGIVGVAIVALVWYYAKQNDHSYNE